MATEGSRTRMEGKRWVSANYLKKARYMPPAFYLLRSIVAGIHGFIFQTNVCMRAMVLRRTSHGPSGGIMAYKPRPALTTKNSSMHSQL